MKNVHKICSFILVIAILFTSTGNVFAETIDDTASVIPLSEELDSDTYAEYLGTIYERLRAAGGIVWEINDSLDSAGMQTAITVPKDGTYTLGISYNSAKHEKSTIALTVAIDGESIAEDVQSLQLDKIYQDAGEVRRDGLGNEFAAEQIDFAQNAFLYPVDSETVKPYQVYLTKGEHIVSLASLNDELFVSALVLRAGEDVEAYTKPEEEAFYRGEPIIREGEKSLWKNSSWLIALADSGSWNVSPADPALKKINYVGGSNWKHTGETITWEIEAPKDGYYQLGFSYRQSYVVNYSSYRRLLIDGECPFAEADSIEFPYGYSWEKMTVSDENGEPYLFYLTEGVHTISLQVTLGEYFDICNRLETVVGELGNLNLKITMITGETVDINRDYDLFQNIPDLEERFEACVMELTELEKEIDRVSDGDSSSYSLVLRNMTRVIRQMLKNKYSAARYKNDFYTNYSNLSVCFSDMQMMPLDIDQIVLSAPGDTKACAEEGWFTRFFKKAGFSLRRFINSFFVDYNSVSGEAEAGETEKLTLWVNWGQDQARVLNALIQTDFTGKYGIPVEVQVVNASVVQAILSGNGPDLVLQQSRTEPVNLAMRGALYDLMQFDDYEEVLKRFADGAATPYYYQGGLYALPDTQTFNVMFYRKDIFEELELEVPTDWDTFNGVTKTLLQNKLSVWLPYTQISSTDTVNTGVGGLTLYPTLLRQNGVDLYEENGTSTTLTSPAALEVFKTWTDYYTKLKLPVEINFYNRFRAGTCPLGITSYSLAVTLTTEAPELEGLWGMAVVPGTGKADGSVNYETAGGGTGCSILSMSENKEAAWLFLKWWTSAETQESYSANLESIVGPLGRVMVSNTEALESLSWTEEELNAILAARENVREFPEYPGGYQVSRSIDMAFYEVVNDGVNEKDVMTEWGKKADDEIRRKWERYGSGVVTYAE